MSRASQGKELKDITPHLPAVMNTGRCMYRAYYWLAVELARFLYSYVVQDPTYEMMPLQVKLGLSTSINNQDNHPQDTFTDQLDSYNSWLRFFSQVDLGPVNWIVTSTESF